METEETKIFEKKVESALKEEPVMEEAKIVPEKKLSREEQIQELANVLYEQAKKDDKIFITIVNKGRDYWNSGDELHYIIVQGRSRELPEDITPTLRDAMSENNKLLREATDIEIKQEMLVRAEEHLISTGKIKPVKKKEEELKL